MKTSEMDDLCCDLTTIQYSMADLERPAEVSLLPRQVDKRFRLCRMRLRIERRACAVMQPAGWLWEHKTAKWRCRRASLTRTIASLEFEQTDGGKSRAV